MKENNRIPYGQLDDLDYRYIKQVRFLRNKTLKQMEEIMGVDYSVISRLERKELNFTPIYQERFRTACRKLRISNIEIASIRKLLEMKKQKGYR